MFRQKRNRSSGRWILGVGVAAAAAYFFDPRMGRSRRARVKDQVGAMFRRGARDVARQAEYARGHVEGLQHAVTSARDGRPPANDATLAAKIESEVLSRWAFPKGSISVNAEEGVVYLRGQCETPDQINDLEQRVRKVSGVVDVVNYLHLPETPAPNKQPSSDIH